MTTRLTFPASMFSVVCQRCGSTLRKSADSCPNCGADRAAAFGEGRAKTRGAEQAKERGGLFKPAGAGAAGAAAGPSLAAAAPVAGAVPPAVVRTPEAVAPASSNAASGAASPPPLSNSAPGSLEADPDALPDSEGWNRRKTVIASVCALVLLAGGTAYLLHDGSADDEDAPPSTQHSASGAIDAKPGGRTQTGALPATTAAPAVSAAIERRPSPDDRPLSIGDTVLAARRAMEQHDLTAARNRLKSIAPAQQSRPDVQRLKDDLAQRELERDAALQLARACEKTSAWACVQQNAGEALALDGSNTESQAMLERVITHAGWLAGTPPLARKKAAPDSAGAVPPAATVAPSTAVAVQPATPPAHVAAATPAPAQTPPPATPQKQAVAAARPPAAPPAEPHATTTPSPARESRRASGYARSAPSSAMADVTVIPAPAISPPLLPTTPATSSTTATRNTSTTAASPSAAHGTAMTATTTATSPATAEHAAPSPTATTRSTVPTTTATPPNPSAVPSYAAPTPVPAARVATAIPSTTAVVTTTAPANTMTTPAPAPIAATATRTAAVTGNTPASTGTSETRPATRAPLPDGENADELERAIKQFGWSGGDAMPKPSR